MDEDNRAKILQLAIDAIDGGGETAIRVNAICAEAGVTPPVLYYHFGSRDGLVIAAHIERYSRRVAADLEEIRREVNRYQSAEELRETLRIVFPRILSERAESRWRRVNVVGSAYARPEFEAAITRAQDELIKGIVSIVEPCQQRGWLRPEIDLASVAAWQHSLLFARVFVERGNHNVDLAEWDRLTVDAIEQAYFGP